MNTTFDNVCRFATVTLLTMIVTPPAFATGQDSIPGAVAVGSTEVLSVAGGLIAVVAAILLASFLYTRMKGPNIGGKNVINIIASQALGPRERILLIEIADTQLVVGLTASSVRTLHVFGEAVVRAAEPAATSNFAERLKSALLGDPK